MRVADFVDFIKARERHRVAKERGWAAVSGGGPRGNRKPDPIISEYRFCNVRRNDDRVTKWIHEKFFALWGDHEHLWFALTAARLFNNEPTLDNVMGQLLPFAPGGLKKTLRGRALLGFKNFNAAYIVSTNGRAMNKIDYVVDHVLTPLWKKRDKLTKLIRVGQLANAHIALSGEQGLGSFMAAQVLADLKYAPGWGPWEDFHSFAASGPGSRRGLNRVVGNPISAPYNEADFRRDLLKLRDMTNMRLKMEPLTAQDIQNCLCEFDKYERARLKEGRPKQKYKPREK